MTAISRAPVLFTYAAGTLMKHFTLSVLTKELHYSYFQNFLLQKITLLRESKLFFLMTRDRNSLAKSPL